jgi:hypothetical protein
MKLPLALAATVNDPDGALLELAVPLWPDLLALHAEIILECSPQTPPEVVNALQRAGATIVQDPTAPNAIESLGHVRLRTMQHAVARGHQHLHLCDWDRVIHWLTHYPAEYHTVARQILDHDFLVIGRTQRAFDSHPEVQRATEASTNRAFAAAYGAALDITAGSRGASARAVSLLSQYSRTATVGVDSEWPILLQRLGLRPGYLEAEGLEYETADRYQAEIEAAGGREDWLTTHVNTPRGWAFRFALAHAIALAALDAATRDDLPSL